MKLNKYIDHTLLSPEATEAQVEKVIKQAIDNHFHTVMINPYWVAKTHKALEEKQTAIQEQMSQPEIAKDIGKLTDLQKELDELFKKFIIRFLFWTRSFFPASLIFKLYFTNVHITLNICKI